MSVNWFASSGYPSPKYSSSVISSDTPSANNITVVSSSSVVDVARLLMLFSRASHEKRFVQWTYRTVVLPFEVEISLEEVICRSHREEAHGSTSIGKDADRLDRLVIPTGNCDWDRPSGISDFFIVFTARKNFLCWIGFSPGLKEIE